MGFKLDISGMAAGLASAASKSEMAIGMYAEQSALQLQNYAREHRKWTDRTGQARQRLTGTSHKIANGYRLELAHGVDYGIWLEMAHERKYSIIPETIDKVGEEKILPGLEHLLERL